MASRGAKPTPTALRILRGNPSGRPLNPNEPKPAVGCPKPKYLENSPAGEVWDEVAPALTASGVLTVIDGDMLASYCILSAAARKEILKAGEMRELIKLANCFGLNPSCQSTDGSEINGNAPRTCGRPELLDSAARSSSPHLVELGRPAAHDRGPAATTPAATTAASRVSTTWRSTGRPDHLLQSEPAKVVPLRA